MVIFDQRSRCKLDRITYGWTRHRTLGITAYVHTKNVPTLYVYPGRQARVLLIAISLNAQSGSRPDGDLGSQKLVVFQRRAGRESPLASSLPWGQQSSSHLL